MSSKQTQKKAEATKKAMENTIQVAIDRNARLSDLNATSQSLANNGGLFEKQTKKVKVAKRKEYHYAIATYICVIFGVTVFGALLVYRFLFK